MQVANRPGKREREEARKAIPRAPVIPQSVTHKTIAQCAVGGSQHAADPRTR